MLDAMPKVPSIDEPETEATHRGWTRRHRKQEPPCPESSSHPEGKITMNAKLLYAATVAFALASSSRAWPTKAKLLTPCRCRRRRGTRRAANGTLQKTDYDYDAHDYGVSVDAGPAPRSVAELAARAAPTRRSSARCAAAPTTRSAPKCCEVSTLPRAEVKAEVVEARARRHAAPHRLRRRGGPDCASHQPDRTRRSWRRRRSSQSASS